MKPIGSVEVVNLADEVWFSKATSPFKLWLAESSGKVDAGIFQIKPQLHVEYIDNAAFMKKLKLECLRSLTPAHYYTHRESTPEEIYQYLEVIVNFEPGDNMELPEDELTQLVKQSLLALMNVPASDKDVTTLMESYKWYEFEAKTSWFYKHDWDFGIMALNLSNNIISILAATDTYGSD